MLNLSEENDFQTPPPPPHPRGGEGEQTSHTDPQTQPQPHPDPLPVLRWRVVGRCPCCLTAWILDIDSTTNPIEAWPAPGKMTDALLCGECQARKRVLYKGQDGVLVSLWATQDVGAMLRNLEDKTIDFAPHITRQRPLVENDRHPVDQIEDMLSKFRRLSVVGDGYLKAVGVNWAQYIRRGMAQRAQKAPQRGDEQLTTNRKAK